MTELSALPSNQAAIRFDRVGFRYPVHHAGMPDTVEITEIGGHIQRDGKRVYVQALEDVSFDVMPGDRVGVIGMNGSGKSTLLRVAAGILPPSTGTVKHNGDVSTLFSLNLGTRPDATGLENLHLLGTLHGIPRRELNAMIPLIAEMTELGGFLDMPMRTYSSGMRSRLGFAFAIILQREILLVDEIIGAGDIAFYERARRELDRMLESTSTLLIASHSEAVISGFCNKAIWLHKGKLVVSGDVPDVLHEFHEFILDYKRRRDASQIAAAS